MTVPKFDDAVPPRCPKCHSTRIIELSTDNWMCYKCHNKFPYPEAGGKELAEYFQKALNELLKKA